MGGHGGRRDSSGLGACLLSFALKSQGHVRVNTHMYHKVVGGAVKIGLVIVLLKVCLENGSHLNVVVGNGMIVVMASIGNVDRSRA
jgi:hypothetical protein